MTRITVSIVALVFGFAQAEVPDGAWNGKPWNRKELESAVTKNDPEALAEMAYWSKEGYQGTPYDEDLIFRYAKISADAGNPYGQTLLSRCYMQGMGVEADLQRAGELARLSFEAGHPLGTKNYANVLKEKRGEAGFDEWKRLTEQSAAAGCQTSFSNLLISYHYGLYGFERDRPRARRMAVDAVRRQDHPNNTTCQFVLTESRFRAAELGITDEMKARVLARLEDAAEAGVAGPMTVIGRYYVQQGDTARGIPLLLKAANAGDTLGERMIFDYLAEAGNRQDHGISSDNKSYKLLGKTISEHFTANHEVMSAAVDYYLLGPERDPGKAQELALKMVEEEMDCRCMHEAMGRTHFSVLTRKELLDPRRGKAHFIYGAILYDQLIRDLGVSHIRLRDGHEDKARGYAAFKRFVKEHPEKTSDVKMIEELWEEMTPEERKEGEELVAQDYPVADQFRKPAYRVLLEYGDIPKDTRFRSFEPAR